MTYIDTPLLRVILQQIPSAEHLTLRSIELIIAKTNMQLLEQPNVSTETMWRTVAAKEGVCNLLIKDMVDSCLRRYYQVRPFSKKHAITGFCASHTTRDTVIVRAITGGGVQFNVTAGCKKSGSISISDLTLVSQIIDKETLPLCGNKIALAATVAKKAINAIRNQYPI